MIDIFVRLSLQYFTTLYYLMYTPDSNCEIAVRMANFVICVDDVIHTGPVTPSFENGKPDVCSLILRVLSQICVPAFLSQAKSGAKSLGSRVICHVLV